MNEFVLQADDVAIHYGGVKAVDGVSLTLKRGQIRGLIGPNGAGKSTVIDAITGRVRLTRGKVQLGGQDVTALGPVARRMRGLSRSFQRTSIFGQMPVRKQVELSAYKMGLADPGADAVLTELDLMPMANVIAEDLGMAEIRRQTPGARLQAEGPPLTIAPGLSEEGLEQLLPKRQITSLADGIAATLRHYRTA